MSVIFRVDANRNIGLGHIVESNIIADELKRNFDEKVIFILKDYLEARKKMKESGFDFYTFPSDYSMNEEIGFIKNIALENDSKVIVTNLMHNVPEYIRSLKDIGLPLISIIVEPIDIDADRTINGTQDHKYIVIDPIFSENSSKKLIRKNCKNLFISFGGSDPFGLTLITLNSLNDVSFTAKINIVIGIAFNFLDELKKLSDKNRHRCFLKNNISKNEIRDLMFDSDLAITAGGNMMYELLATHTPVITLCPLERQRRVADIFSKYGAVQNLGLYLNVDKKEIKNCVESLWFSFDKRKEMSLKTKGLIDGKGSLRVAEIIYSYCKD